MRRSTIGWTRIGLGAYRSSTGARNLACRDVPQRVLVETTCVDVDADGLHGICVYETAEGRRRAIFVPGALPGAVIQVSVVDDVAGVAKKKGKLTYGEAVEVKKAHDGKVVPMCEHFGAGQCGGCTLQEVSYQCQLKIKTDRVRNAYERIAGLPARHPALLALEIQGSPMEYRYRNRVEFSLASGDGMDQSNRVLVLGKHRRGKKDVVEVRQCALQGAAADACYQAILDFFRSGYDLDGVAVEYIVIRQSTYSGEILVNVATRARANSLVGALAAHIHKCGTSLSLRGVVNSVLVAGSPVELRRVQEEHVVYGVGYLEERLGEVVYKVSPNSFFQVNTPLTELLYRHVVQAAALRPSDVVYDLFCGSGTIGLFLAKGMAGTVQPRHIIGIEVAKSSVSDARHNAEVNGVDFATFVHGDVGDVRRIIKEEGYPKPDVIVCDPARSGLSKRALESILVLAPRTLVYVSCDVSTQARDVKRLVGSGRYQVAQLKSFDMYPQTTHVEAVCTLTRI